LKLSLGGNQKFEVSFLTSLYVDGGKSSCIDCLKQSKLFEKFSRILSEKKNL
jgi:hypothetical protein